MLLVEGAVPVKLRHGAGVTYKRHTSIDKIFCQWSFYRGICVFGLIEPILY